MVFALRFKFQEAAGIHILTTTPSAFADFAQLLVQIGKRCAFDTAGDAGEAQVHYVFIHADQFEQIWAQR